MCKEQRDESQYAKGLYGGGGVGRSVRPFEPGCPYCRLWDREIAPVYPKTAEARRAPLQAIDRHDPALAALKLASPVRYTPTFVLMEKGEELGRIEGYPGEHFFWGRLATLLDRLPAAPQ